MGFLTPILIKNDIAHLFKDKKLQKQICEKLYNAMIDGDIENISINNKRTAYCNYISSLGPKHADVTRVIIVNGNTWIDVGKEIYKTERTDKNYLKHYLNILIDEVRFLKDKIKELEGNK